MSNIQVRKNELNKYLSNGDLSNRFVSLFSKDEAKAEKFKATIVNLALDNSLSSCTIASILKSALDIAEINLPLAKGLGQAYIVRYKSDAEPVIGYKGWLALAERGGKIVKTKPIFKCDHFNMIDNGFDEIIDFIPNLNERKEYEPKWVEENLNGILVSYKDNSTGVISNNYVSFGKIKQLAGKSPARNSKYSPYVDWSLEMYQGKAIKYILSKTPMNEAIAKAIEIDNKVDIDNINEQKQSKGLDLNKLINSEEQEDIIDTTVSNTQQGEQNDY